jgi:ABC-type proline/glycine betaine transport system substrate-binding protein
VRRTTLAALAALALACLSACSSEEEAPAAPAAAIPVSDIGEGDICARLTAGVLEDIVGEPFEESETVPPPATLTGRADSCFGASPDSGTSVSVDVWTKRQADLEADILQYGSPAATGELVPTEVEGHDAVSAVADQDGKLMADLAIDVDGRLLLVLVQRFTESADGTTPEDQLDLATTIAERLLPA